MLYCCSDVLLKCAVYGFNEGCTAEVNVGGTSCWNQFMDEYSTKNLWTKQTGAYTGDADLQTVGQFHKAAFLGSTALKHYRSVYVYFICVKLNLKKITIT